MCGQPVGGCGYVAIGTDDHVGDVCGTCWGCQLNAEVSPAMTIGLLWRLSRVPFAYRYMLSGIDLSQRDYDGRTPLHVAASEGTCI